MAGRFKPLIHKGFRRRFNDAAIRAAKRRQLRAQGDSHERGACLPVHAGGVGGRGSIGGVADLISRLVMFCLIMISSVRHFA
jgi:hypothetical protein